MTCISVCTDGWYEIHELIVSGKIDLCIATKFEEPEVAGTYIGDHPLVVIVPENHYLASRERVDLRELQDENFIGFNQNGQLAPMLQKTFASLGIEPRVVSRTPSDLIIYGLVAGGRGVSVVPFPLTITHLLEQSSFVLKMIFPSGVSTCSGTKKSSSRRQLATSVIM